MRHRNGNRKLNRTSSHRAAMLRNMANSLLTHETIVTTLPKAKELRSYVEKLITTALRRDEKGSDFNAHRAVFAKLQDKVATKKLVEQIAPKFADKNGGYTRILKTRLRKGDAAEMAFIEFTA